ncbi:MAG: hypothetical protein ACOX5Z_13330 [Desulfobulbus sp.]
MKKARDRFERILRSCRERIQDEVSSLISKPLELGEPQFQLLSKEDLFAELGGKQVLVRIRLEGEIAGEGCLLVGVKDAIYIGGALIMLPDGELDAMVASQEYSEELQDSFGEVANIVCGAATLTFEEQYPKNVRLVRMEQEVITPIKVDIASDQPIADGSYYLATSSVQLDGRPLDVLHLVLPALPFGLVEKTAEASVEEAEEDAAPAAATPGAAASRPASASVVETAETANAPSQSAAQGAAEPVAAPEPPAGEVEQGATPAAATPGPAKKRDPARQQRLVDSILKSSLERMCDEVGALVGGVLELEPIENQAVTKEDFLDQAGGKQIMTRMDLRGDREGECLLFVDIKTAVYLGGALIMLPESELEETARREEFGDDANDAYGEVGNIIAGALSSSFEEQYRVKVGFVKTTVEPVVPSKIDPDSDAVFVNRGYYLCLAKLVFNGRDMGRMQLLIPLSALDLDELLVVETTDATVADTVEKPAGAAATAGVRSSAARGAAQGADAPVGRLHAQSGGDDILLFTDDDAEAGRIANILEEGGRGCRILHFKDPVASVLSARTRMVFVIMREVNEQGFGMAIKVSSTGLRVPLVAAGPAWTRTLVLKAVKYGAHDILITPASADDVREKLETNLEGVVA